MPAECSGAEQLAVGDPGRHILAGEGDFFAFFVGEAPSSAWAVPVMAFASIIFSSRAGPEDFGSWAGPMDDVSVFCFGAIALRKTQMVESLREMSKTKHEGKDRKITAEYRNGNGNVMITNMTMYGR